MEQQRFYYHLDQKLTILDRTLNGRLFESAIQYPNVTQQQLENWYDHREEMLALGNKAANKKTLHKGPPLKYGELFQFLLQRVRDLRAERKAVTVELLISIAEQEQEEIRLLTAKGKESLIRRFMDYFDLSIRAITGSSGFRPEQEPEEQSEERLSFLREFRRIIVEKQIPVSSIFNMDQTGIYYENAPARTIDFVGQKEIPVMTNDNSKKRITLYSLLDASGQLHPQMLVFKGVRDGRVHQEVIQHDDWFSRHTCQVNAWCEAMNFIEWASNIWHPIARNIDGPKLLLLDSYPIHKDFQQLLSKFETYVLYIPARLTFALQPLDQGFHKSLKDELRKKWVSNQELDLDLNTERERREALCNVMKDVWLIMADKPNETYWTKAGLSYPEDQVHFRSQQQVIGIQEREQEEDSAMEIEN